MINGVHEGETGLVLKVLDDKVTLLGDLSMEELKVFVRDLQLTTEVSAGVDSLGQHVLHDLVQINPHTVGCIVKVEREAFRVVDQQGQVRRVRAQEVTQKRGVRDAVALDSQHNQVKVGDVVNVIDGPNKGIQGTVKHIFRSFLFLHSREKVENSGIFVARARGTLTLGGSKSAGQGGLNAMGQGPRPFGGGMFGGARGRGGSIGRGRGRGRDPLIYANVTITQGPFKGMIGAECRAMVCGYH